MGSWQDRTLSTISSALDTFVEFTVLIQEKLNIAEDELWPAGGPKTRQASNDLMHRFRDIDGEAVKQAQAFWRDPALPLRTCDSGVDPGVALAVVAPAVDVDLRVRL